jgi:hypothetical protein
MAALALEIFVLVVMGRPSAGTDWEEILTTLLSIVIVSKMKAD